MKINILKNFYILYRKKSFKQNEIFNNFLKNLDKDKNFNRSFYYNFNKNYIKNVNLNKLKKFKRYKNIIIIGLGGSSLGTMAIHSLFEEKLRKMLFF